MKHPLPRYLVLAYPGAVWTTHEMPGPSHVEGTSMRVGNYILEWHDKTPAPTPEEILAKIPELDPIIDEQLAKEARVKEFRRKWPAEQQARAQFDDNLREEMRRDLEAL